MAMSWRPRLKYLREAGLGGAGGQLQEILRGHSGGVARERRAVGSEGRSEVRDPKWALRAQTWRKIGATGTDLGEESEFEPRARGPRIRIPRPNRRQSPQTPKSQAGALVSGEIPDGRELRQHFG